MFRDEVQAETVNFGSLTFNIEKSEQVSESETKIVVAGKEIIVPSAAWQAQALTECLLSQCQIFELSALLKIVRAKELQTAPQGLAAALTQYIEKNSTPAALLRVLRKDLIAELLIGNQKGAEFVSQVCLSKVDLSAACSDLATVMSRYELALVFMDAGNPEGLLLLLSSLQGLAETEKFSAQIVQGLKKIVEKQPQNSKTISIFRLFSLIPNELLTAEVLSIMQEQILRFVGLSVDHQDLEDFISAHFKILALHTEVMAQLEQILEHNVKINYTNGNLDLANQFLNTWSLLSEHQGVLSRSSQIQLYIWLGRFGKTFAASNLYSRLLPELGFFDRLHLFLVEYFPRASSWGVILLASLLVVIATALGIAKLRRKFQAMRVKNSFIKESEDEEEQSRRVFSVGALAISPKMLRYKDCLRLIGIETQASIKDIKAAYRAAVKDAHPDLHQDQGIKDNSQSDKFIELTKAYDEALNLHREIASDEESI